MNKKQVRDRITAIGLVPVVRASSAREAHLAVEAMCEGGVPIAEITMTVPGAVDIIRDLLRENHDGLIIGAGTVLNPQTARQCIEAGAQFIVSPGLDLRTVNLAVREDVLMFAGALTPTEIMSAWDAGADFVKVFPCANMGGAAYIKALRGPFPDIPFVPTGGVNLLTAAAFIQAGAAALGVGGEMIQRDALQAGKADVIAESAHHFLAAVREARNGLGHAKAVAS